MLKLGQIKTKGLPILEYDGIFGIALVSEAVLRKAGRVRMEKRAFRGGEVLFRNRQIRHAIHTERSGRSALCGGEAGRREHTLS